jgi:hypothetical protein
MTDNRAQVKRYPKVVSLPSSSYLESIFKDDYRCMQLFKELIYRASQHDNQVVNLHSGPHRGVKTVALMKGEVIFGRRRFAQYLAWDDKSTERALQKLSDYYNVVSHRPTHDYTVVSIQNYDALTEVTHLWLENNPQPDHASDPPRGPDLDRQYKTNAQEDGKSDPQSDPQFDPAMTTSIAYASKLAANSSVKNETTRKDAVRAAITEILRRKGGRGMKTAEGGLAVLNGTRWEPVKDPVAYLEGMGPVNKRAVQPAKNYPITEMLGTGHYRITRLVDGKEVTEILTEAEYMGRTDV